MLKQLITKIFIALFVFGTTVELHAQKKPRARKKKTAITAPVTKPKPAPKKGAIQPYGKVITKDTKTDDGVFKVHHLEDRFFYEIPDTLLNREMLMVTRISKTASGLGFGGSKESTQVLRWQKKGQKILARIVSHDIAAADSLPINEAVVNSNFEPILYSFPIKAFGKDSTSTVIDVTDFFSKDVRALGINQGSRKRYKISRLEGDKSFIESIKSYPLNIEARHVKTYMAGSPPSNTLSGTVSVEINNSMILLPKTPMKRRIFDRRVGWFTSRQVDYGLEAHKTKSVSFLDRWRLEVKDEDIEKFKRGELVEPKEPIVYYIDRATPLKWRKYLKQGIEDWQVAFEAAGFKNAIIAKNPPSVEEDPEWSPEDVRYSVVRYLASPIPNANGPHVSDPRSGEILESDINWYHNVMTLVHDWFFVQTSAVNPDARAAVFKDEVMGELIRFVSSHELGHTLGLPHNMGSSNAYPVDSLRSKTFTQKYGTAPSIMDYARFNYVAQPEDEGVYLFPKIGVYDKYAVSWGYRPILDAKTAEDEKKTLDSWILKHAGNPLYRFGRQQGFGPSLVDPSSQTEDLGDDAVKASTYGIANLKRTVPNLIDWTAEDGKNYDDLKVMYKSVVDQFNRYMGHVTSNIGGVYENFKTYDQEGDNYTHVPKSKQKESLLFINKQLFETPNWLIVPSIYNKFQGSGGLEYIKNVQSKTLNNILDYSRMDRMIENEALNGSKAYSLTEMMRDLRKAIWSEIYSGKSIDTYKRNLQRMYVDRMAYLFKSKATNSDPKAIVRAELKSLRYSVKTAASNSSGIKKIHLQDLAEQIDNIINPK